MPVRGADKLFGMPINFFRVTESLSSVRICPVGFDH